MQDKKSFGKYIAEKRKEANLTQEELANKLYVIPTTISKWERGITYPDITVITNLCKELNISEHEFFTACDDESFHQEKREIKKYRTIKKGIFYILNIGYFIGILTCFICNLVTLHTLSWFFIALFGILISFTITSLPFYLKNNKYRWIKVFAIFTILVYFLLFVINYVNHGNWFFSSFLIASFVFILLWIEVIICTFTNMDNTYKISTIFLSLAVLTAFTNPVVKMVLNITSSREDIYNINAAIALLMISVVIAVGKFLSQKNNDS